MFTNRSTRILGASILAACAFSRTAVAAADPTVLFMADTQIHNVYGGQVKQTWGISDWFSGVARRNPEMNLLSRYALQDFIQRGEQMAQPGDPTFMVMLGDATNAACTGEYDRFMGTVKAGNPDRIVLMAHGNHDSYLMGTINYWQAPVAGIDLTKFSASAFPVDETWWPADDHGVAPVAQSWMALCHQNEAGPSTPMHKIQWIAKYLRSLARPQADGSSDLKLVPGQGSGKELPFSGYGKPGTSLSALNYRVKGIWTRPTDAGDGLMDTYNSFLVQAVDIGASHRLILIDTAACSSYKKSWFVRFFSRYFAQNAGITACLQRRQRDLIKELIVESKDSKRTIIFAGHHPLKNFEAGDRQDFMDLMTEASGKAWVYVSAHTHHDLDTTPKGSGAKEINIGSTTDWPMNAFRIRFGASVTATRVLGPEPTVLYKAPEKYPDGPEMCRHLDAALKLRDMEVDAEDYASPGNRSTYGKCIDEAKTKWAEYEKKLYDAEREIERRMNNAQESGYRQRVLSIMAAASQAERASFSLDKYLP